jgi:hypothetical protein
VPFCPLKYGLQCEATPDLAMESRCDCPCIPQCDLYDHRHRSCRPEAPLLIVMEEDCLYVEDYTCSAESCPDGCKLPHICETCGYEPCVHFGGDYYEAERNCWIPPYYHDKGGTPEQYWPDADDDEGVPA